MLDAHYGASLSDTGMQKDDEDINDGRVTDRQHCIPHHHAGRAGLLPFDGAHAHL